MKKRQIVLILAATLAAYVGVYATLRFTRYFVRQEFLCMSCSATLMQQIRKDHPAARAITVESERNQIGCGRIQKGGKRFAESVLLPLILPPGELEMILRGYSETIVSAFDNVTEDAGSEGPYTRATLLGEYRVTRRDQIALKNPSGRDEARPSDPPDTRHF